MAVYIGISPLVGGGFYERLVKVVKSALWKVLKKAKLNYDELTTVLIEVENMLNSRPLTYMSNENIEAITPFHLLHGRNIASRGNQIGKMYCSEAINSDDIENRVKYIQSLIGHYWKRFFQEYTVVLRERMLYDKSNRKDAKIMVGDIVIIKDDKLKPTHWKHGRILELISGRDGVIRGVKIQSSSPTGKTVQISRSVQKIIPLEICARNSISVNETVENDNTSDVDIDNTKAAAENDIDLDNSTSNDIEITSVKGNENDVTSCDDQHKKVRTKRAAALAGLLKRRLAK